MRITKIRPSSKCKDGSLVKEYCLSRAVDDRDITALQKAGMVTLKDIGGNSLFTFSSDIMAVKGMIGDTVIYLSCKKEDFSAAEVLMMQIFG